MFLYEPFLHNRCKSFQKKLGHVINSTGGRNHESRRCITIRKGIIF